MTSLTNNSVDSFKEASSSQTAVRHCHDHTGTVAMATAAAADPELCVKTEMPRLEDIIGASELSQLSDKERRRQDVVNGS